MPGNAREQEGRAPAISVGDEPAHHHSDEPPIGMPSP
jgi:hypothetical protein